MGKVGLMPGCSFSVANLYVSITDLISSAKISIFFKIIFLEF